MKIDGERLDLERVDKCFYSLHDIDGGELIFAGLWYLSEAKSWEVRCLGIIAVSLNSSTELWLLLTSTRYFAARTDMSSRNWWDELGNPETLDQLICQVLRAA